MFKRNSIEYRIWMLFLIVIIALFAVFGFGFGTVFITGLLLYISCWMYFRMLSIEYPKHRIILLIKNTMLIVFVAWFISFLILESAVIANGHADESIQGEYLLVLGAGLRGETPSVSLKSRLDKAVEFLAEQKDIKILVSGGQGKGESITEAEAMKRYLIDMGIDQKRIIKEEQSTSTKENLLFSKDILNNLEGNKKHKLILITSDFHICRTKILAKQAGLEISVLPAETPFSIYINYCIREYFAFIKMYLE